ncbi:hypothetical protein C0Q70_18432 [Pomacea canaliculata]|uniref:Uncharacterized protein n=1 Tax=Pomacea canaliculata TaxID=400727 RepID=A0A2T7NN83_POMCA|nr:hypothetical protein C0Q70_18432 [Pomacea canaliculata]
MRLSKGPLQKKEKETGTKVIQPDPVQGRTLAAIGDSRPQIDEVPEVFKQRFTDEMGHAVEEDREMF